MPKRANTVARILSVACSGLLVSCPLLQAQEKETSAMSGSPAIQHRFGGMGGLFLYPERGELVVDVQRWKRTSKDRDTHLRAVLFAPDRSVLHDVLLPGPGDGKPGSQRVRLTTTVRHLGVYGLVITSPEDRYGEYTHWGFRTNCPKYIIETSRGHRDRRHEEPIVLANPDVAGDLCFLPRTKAFRIALHGLRAAEERITLADAKGRVLATLKPNAKGKAFHDVPASEARGDVPWTLHFPKFKTVAEIDGVTRWEDDDLYRNMALWTPNAESWFPLPENRWILQPYQQRVHAAPDEAGTVTFTVHNNETVEKVIDLALEFDDTPWSATVSESAVRVPPRQSVQVTLSYRMPMTGNSWACRLRATPRKSPEFTTYSSFNLAAKDVPADGTVKMPIALKPYVHENKQYGYIREYPVDQQMYFDSSHRPYVLGSRGIHAFRDGAWSITPFPEAEGQGEAEAVRPKISKIAFDRKDNLYTVVKVDKRLSLLRSKDQGTTSDLTPLPSGGSFDIEQFSGHNVPAGPPPLIRVVRTKKDPKLIWRSLNDLSLIIPAERADGSIDVGKPILISRKCIGLCSHSGIPSFVVSRDQKVHVAWGEATDPAAKAPGVPTYVATYDRETGVLGEPALIGYGPPANDCHNSPCITMDSKGYLHVLVGTHGRTFKYARSLKPNDAYGGWTETEDVGKKLSQTYVGLVCDKDDVLHLVFRLWRHDGKYQPHGGYATLAHMTKSPEQPWSQPRVLVAAAFANYSIFYHRLTIDHRGRPVLSYDYWSTYWFYRNDRRQRQRGLLLSDDGGVTWKLATNNDLR